MKVLSEWTVDRGMVARNYTSNLQLLVIFGSTPTHCLRYRDPNRWLGMVFGMAARLAWGGLGTNLSAVEATPEVQEVIPVWRFWGDWGIANAAMIGVSLQALPLFKLIVT